MMDITAGDVQQKPYEGNPFIDRLPPILTKDAFENRTILLPDYDAKLRTAPYEVRLHYISAAHDLFIPFPRHYQLHMSIDRMIRRGYKTRNPMNQVSYWRDIREQHDALSTELTQYPKLQRSDLGQSSELSQALIGLSGSGKTWGAEASLSYYPKKIVHGKHNDVGLNIVQVPWLWIQAPSKSSTNELCNEFFLALDRIVDDDYYKRFGNRVLREMMDQMANLCSLHAIGVLVIDEIQEVANIKSGGHEALIGFFLKLTNRLRIPILMIGTYKAKAILFNQLRLARRSCGAGLPEWSPLNKVGEWEVLSKAIWTHQYTRTFVPWSQELSDTLYEESQGIADVAVKLFVLAQQRAILARGPAEKERISAKLFKSIATRELEPLKPILDALKNRDYPVLVLLDDVKLPSIQEMLALRNSEQIQIAVPEVTPTPPEPCPSFPQSHGTQDAPGAPSNAPSAPEPRLILKPVLTEIAKQAQQDPKKRDPQVTYQALRLAGWIKQPNEFWSET